MSHPNRTSSLSLLWLSVAAGVRSDSALVICDEMALCRRAYSAAQSCTLSFERGCDDEMTRFWSSLVAWRFLISIARECPVFKRSRHV